MKPDSNSKEREIYIIIYYIYISDNYINIIYIILIDKD